MPAVAQPTFRLLCISIILQCVGGCNNKSQGGAAPVVTCQAEQRLHSLPTDVTTIDPGQATKQGRNTASVLVCSKVTA